MQLSSSDQILTQTISIICVSSVRERMPKEGQIIRINSESCFEICFEGYLLVSKPSQQVLITLEVDSCLKRH